MKDEGKIMNFFDMYEGVWWLDQFMYEQDNVEAVNRLKDKT